MNNYQLYLLLANIFLLASFFKSDIGGLLLIFLGLGWLLLAVFDYKCNTKRGKRKKKMKNSSIQMKRRYKRK